MAKEKNEQLLTCLEECTSKDSNNNDLCGVYYTGDAFYACDNVIALKIVGEENVETIKKYLLYKYSSYLFDEKEKNLPKDIIIYTDKMKQKLELKTNIIKNENYPSIDRLDNLGFGDNYKFENNPCVYQMYAFDVLKKINKIHKILIGLYPFNSNKSINKPYVNCGWVWSDYWNSSISVGATWYDDGAIKLLTSPIRKKGGEVDKFGKRV